MINQREAAAVVGHVANAALFGVVARVLTGSALVGAAAAVTPTVLALAYAATQGFGFAGPGAVERPRLRAAADLANAPAEWVGDLLAEALGHVELPPPELPTDLPELALT